jgi:hypothetical protein
MFEGFISGTGVVDEELVSGVATAMRICGFHTL